MRQELFAQNLVKGMTQNRAYIKAGYTANTPQAGWSNASRLIRDDKVSNRIDELLKTTETELKITVESMTNVYADILSSAKQVGNFNAAKGAADSLAKLHGLMIDRKEAGAPGDFSRMDDDQLKQFISNTASELSALSGRSEGEDQEEEEAGC
jgi:phage terminase small subunit